ncbi:MAG: nicotinamide-nucleotide amidohydrolase family protein [Pirellulaceae bacterium]
MKTPSIVFELTELLLPYPERRIVFAESCTAGLVSALVASTPGISQNLCGSAVTYRWDTKQKWLGVTHEILEQCTAESIEVAQAMALGVLERTPEANWSAAITGHLGPGAPSDIDGKIFMAVARNLAGSIEVTHDCSQRLVATERIARQHEAASLLISLLAEAIRSIDNTTEPTR